MFHLIVCLLKSSILKFSGISFIKNSRAYSVFTHDQCPIMLNGHDEVSPIILTMEATTTVGDKIRFMVRPTVIRIQVE